MAQSQHPKTMKVEMMKSIKTWVCFNARFETHKQLSVFCFSNHAKATCHYQNLVITNRGKYCKFTVKTKVSGSWGGDHICIYIYIYIFRLTSRLLFRNLACRIETSAYMNMSSNMHMYIYICTHMM